MVREIPRCSSLNSRHGTCVGYLTWLNCDGARTEAGVSRVQADMVSPPYNLQTGLMSLGAGAGDRPGELHALDAGL